MKKDNPMDAVNAALKECYDVETLTLAVLILWRYMKLHSIPIKELEKLLIRVLKD